MEDYSGEYNYRGGTGFQQAGIARLKQKEPEDYIISDQDAEDK